MIARLLLIGLLCVSMACRESTPMPDDVVWLRVERKPGDVSLGRAFPVTVIRGWRDDVVPEPWREDLLAPMLLKTEGVSVRHADGRTEETRRCLGYVFERDHVVIEPAYRATGEGDSRFVAAAPAFELTVTSSLGAEPGPVDWLPPRPHPRRFWRWAAAATLAVGVLAWLWRRRRRRAAETPEPAAAPPEETGPGPEERARERLRALRGSSPNGYAAIRAYHDEAADLLRDLLAERHGFPAGRRTTEELTSAATRCGERRAALDEALRPTDLVKFARHETTSAERDVVLTALERVIGPVEGGSS